MENSIIDNIKWDHDKYEYRIEIPIGNQTFHMSFQETYATMDSVYFRIYMTLYSKRKQIKENENKVLTTGKSPWETYVAARQAFLGLHNECLRGFNNNYNVIIYCTWLDNKRRDAYYKLLSRRGFKFGNLMSRKVIMKKYKKGKPVFY